MVPRKNYKVVYEFETVRGDKFQLTFYHPVTGWEIDIMLRPGRTLHDWSTSNVYKSDHIVSAKQISYQVTEEKA